MAHEFRALRSRFPRCIAIAALAVASVLPSPAQSSGVSDAPVLAAHAAFRAGDAARVASARAQLGRDHPLAPWVDYWALNLRLPQATPAEVDAFYSRWGGTYVEDRLRNDWLLELGKRRDWATFRRDFPRFRMNDDPQVTCYALLTEHLDGRVVRDRALDAWIAQRDTDDGCHLMARSLLAGGVFAERDVWRKVRVATEQNRPRAARSALGLLGAIPKASAQWWEQPERVLNRTPASRPGRCWPRASRGPARCRALWAASPGSRRSALGRRRPRPVRDPRHGAPRPRPRHRRASSGRTCVAPPGECRPAPRRAGSTGSRPRGRGAAVPNARRPCAR